MRKHDVRKWLHAILDLLPVILIPVFMIYSHRHTIDSGSIDVPQNQVVDFNQLNNYSLINAQEWTDRGISCSVVDNEFVIDNQTCPYNSYLPITSFEFKSNHQYVIRTKGYNNPTGAQFYIFESGLVMSNTDSKLIVPSVDYISPVYCRLYLYGSYIDTPFSLSCYINIFDITQMFGSGNEPTLQEFNTYFPNDFYDYTLSKKILLKGTSTITYDEPDIMSQVVYQLYNSVDKYFNMGNVFNMTGVYDWFNLNIFNGNAPISIYIVWNIVLYEFVMDLLFLLYGLFMWFIDMVEKLMEKPLKSVK